MIEDQEGVIRVLNPLRHDNSIEPRVIEVAEAGADVRGALAGDEQIFTTGLQDYRGISVWSATRHLAHLNWGLVVKVDVSEEEKRANVLQEALIDIAVALSAFAIIGGALLGFYLARPIHELAVIVERMRHGEDSLRAEVKGDDEIAFLAEALNEFLDHLEDEQKKSAEQSQDQSQEKHPDKDIDQGRDA